MRRMFRGLIPIVVLVLLAVAIYVWRAPLLAWGRSGWARLSGAGTAQGSAEARLIVSGVIEARSVDVAAPAAGRVRVLRVADGQRVQPGDPVAELDTALLDAQIRAADAAVKVAEAQAAQMRAKIRPVDVAVVRAAVKQAEANAAAARTAADDARKLVAAPALIDVSISQAETLFRVATEQLDAAAAAATAADLEQQFWGRIVQRLEAGMDIPLPPQLGGGTRHVDTPADKLAEARLQWNLKSQAAWEAHAQHATATAAADAARQALADLRAERAQPVALEGQAQAAEAAVPVVDAAVVAARANQALLEAGVSAEQVAVADAAVARAAAAQKVLEARRPQYRVLAPRGGLVTEVVLREGEVAAAGAPIVRLSDIDQATLTAYVPAARMSEVHVGGAVATAVDAFPARTFQGVVMNIAGEAEFTPKNVQTREERAGTVFAVKISLANSDGALKAGMAAGVFFCAQEGACEFPYEPVQTGATGGLADIASRILPQPSPTVASPLQADRGYAGSLEATSVRVAAEVGGRALMAPRAEGDMVQAGQVVVSIEGEELAAQRVEADAAVAAAEAERARIAARPQPERIAQVEAGVQQAEAAVTAAEARLAAAQAQRAKPQDLDRQISGARQQIATAAAAVDVARAQLKSAQVLHDSLQNPGSDEDKTRVALYAAQIDAASARLRAAQAQHSGATAVLGRLNAIRAHPVALDAAVHKAESDVATAEAVLAAARATLEQVKAPPIPEAIAVAEARIAQAEANRAVIDTAQTRLTVTSPIAGQVILQSIQAGEVVNPGTPLLTVADLSRLHLAVYVPLPELGALHLGQAADVTVDAYPGRMYSGFVTQIAQQAEFTPRNVQSAEERARMVLRVEVTLNNVEGALRPGMGAEARFR